MAQKMIHSVRKPFMCRVGQFEEGKQSLCVGLDLSTVLKFKEFRCYLGNNKRTYYEILSEKAIKIGHEWTNPKGKTVLIIPIKEFKTVKTDIEEEPIDLFNIYAKMPAKNREEIRNKLGLKKHG